MKYLLKIWPLWILLALSGSLWFLPVPSLFQLKEVVVLKSPQRLSEKELVQLSGVTKGDNLVTLSLKKVHRRLVEQPWIENVQLAKSYPGRLVVSVQEEVPFALVKLEKLYLLNPKGKVFKKLESGDPKDLPVITGLNDLSREDQAVSLKSFTGLIQDFQELEELRSIGLSEIHWDKAKGVSIFTIQPVMKVRLGEEKWKQRLDRLIQVLPEVKAKKEAPLSIDLTYEKRVFIKKS